MTELEKLFRALRIFVWCLNACFLLGFGVSGLFFLGLVASH